MKSLWLGNGGDVDVSRKDYIKIAEAIREYKNSPLPIDWKVLADKFAVALKRDNPRFSYEKFWDYIEK